MDLLRIYEAVKIFLKEESDTFFGLVLFWVLGVVLINYISGQIDVLKPFATEASFIVLFVVLIPWLFRRRIITNKEKFTIAVAPFNLLRLKVDTTLTSEARRDLRRELVDYVSTALHFNKNKLYLDNHLEVIRLPNRIKITPKNAQKMAKKLNVDLLIWGDSYYDPDTLHFRPKFSFKYEPTNTYYQQFKKQLNNLTSFNLKIADNIENQNTELSQLMHYLSYLGLMFHGINQSHNGEYTKANTTLNIALKKMHKKAFTNRSLTDIYLATRFFAAQNLHKWGSALIEEKYTPEAKNLYTQAAHSLLARNLEMKKHHENNTEATIEHGTLYAIYLLAKAGKHTQALKELEKQHKMFGRERKYLYYLYKGLLQRNTKTAERYFKEAQRTAKNKALVNEKIADYYYSKGEFGKATKYFEQQLGASNKQVYNPALIEEKAHAKLSKAYLQQGRLIASITEKIKATRAHDENMSNDNVLRE